MARKPSQRDDAVTTEPVSDIDVEDQFVGGMDLATGLCLFTFLFILTGIGFVYWNLRSQYDVNVAPELHYVGVERDARGEPVQAAGEGGGEATPPAEGGGETPTEGGGETPAEGGGEATPPAEGGGDSGGDDGFGD
jgi:hypothetical protein